jgi:lipopolysaccharide biosynthesis protein
MNNVPCSIFFHNYYGQHEKWMRFFSEKMNIKFNLFYNIVEDSIYTLNENSLEQDIFSAAKQGNFLQKSILCKSSNQGKDLGGKMVLMDAYLRSGFSSEYILFLQDKRSPYKVQNEEWKKKLFRIVDPSFIDGALSVFKDNRNIGIVASAESILNEYDYSIQAYKSNNKAQLLDLQQKYQINTKDHLYIAGTMFWARAVTLENFFTNYNPLDIRSSFEKGNVMDENSGSITHAWERLISWLITAQGYGIKGI